MSDADIPEGRRFSHVYLYRGEPSRDSARLRKRLAALVSRSANDGAIASVLEAELGIDVKQYVTGEIHPNFFRDAELRDLLDSITLIHHALWKKTSGKAAGFRAEVMRLFAEENVGYRVDDRGGVHYLVDTVFETDRAAVIAALSGPRYRNVLEVFETGISALDQHPLNGKFAVRGVFASAEGLFRLMFLSAPRLGAAEVDKWLRPLVEAHNQTDPTAKRATAKIVGSFKEWVDGAHFYRHEPGSEEPAQPPIGLAILLISQGASFIRWLAEIDKATPSMGSGPSA